MPTAKPASHFKPISIRKTREDRARTPCQCVQSAKRTDRIEDAYAFPVGLAVGRRMAPSSRSIYGEKQLWRKAFARRKCPGGRPTVAPRPSGSLA
jgi:hypothetical protein